MPRLLFILLAFSLLSGCASPHFAIPADEYRARVRTLGVVPLLVDADSAIDHPERDRVVEVVRRGVAEADLRLIELLRQQKSYFDVRRIETDPRELAPRLLRSFSAVGEGPERHRRYQLDPAAVAAECTRAGVDALVVIVLHGEVRTEKRWDRAALSATFLEAPFSLVVASAVVVDARANVLWALGGEAPAVLDLSYPAFDEAFYNRSDRVQVYPLRSDGLERTLIPEKPGSSSAPLFHPPLENLMKRIARDLDTRPRRPF